MGRGRPTIMTKQTIGKLEQAFAFDATVREACFYADIHPDTYYDYIKKHPDFSDRCEALRNKPILKARETVVRAISTNPDIAFKYLERKRKDEFSTRVEST